MAKPLGQSLPIEFNNQTGDGIQLEKYFNDKLNAKGKPEFWPGWYIN